MPHVNAAGLSLIKTFEGCRLTSYDDGTGVWTIGYGHTGPDVHEGQNITQAQADEMLQSDLARFEKGVNNFVSRNLTPNQFSAMVSFAYNLGLEALRDSTLLKLVNAGAFEAAADQFGAWVFAGGQYMQGLARRRAAERQLFLTP